MFHPFTRAFREERAHDWGAITSRNGCGEVCSDGLGRAGVAAARSPTEEYGGGRRRAARETARCHRRSS